MDYTGCPFGWIIAGNIDYPIAHHAGIILQWNEISPLKSIVAHYGAWSKPHVRMETLYDAAIHCESRLIHINPHYRATFNEQPYTIDIDGYIAPSNEICDYVLNHSAYNIHTSNCQHFVRHFIEGIPLESDLLDYTASICRSLFNRGVLGSQNDIRIQLDNTINLYKSNRDNGVCKWDRSLDISI